MTTHECLLCRDKTQSPANKYNGRRSKLRGAKRRRTLEQDEIDSRCVVIRGTGRKQRAINEGGLHKMSGWPCSLGVSGGRCRQHRASSGTHGRGAQLNGNGLPTLRSRFLAAAPTGSLATLHLAGGPDSVGRESRKGAQRKRSQQRECDHTH